MTLKKLEDWDRKTEQLHMPDIEANYIGEFEATVVAVDPDRNSILLDRTAFYPLGGGQPADGGTIEVDGAVGTVKDVVKDLGIIHHVIEGMDVGEDMLGRTAKGAVAWDRRLGHMRMHTAQHLISAIVKDMYGADTVGNQIHAERSRIDFEPLDRDQLDTGAVESRFNEFYNEGKAVTISTAMRDVLVADPKVRVNLERLPKSVKELRIVEIDSFDICPCAGTHIRSLSELAPIKIVKVKSKGSGRLRIEYVFDE